MLSAKNVFNYLRNIDWHRVWDEFTDYFWITIGLAIYTLGFSMFILPYKIVGGGVSGVSTIVYYISNGAIGVDVTYFAINAVLLVFALWLLGIKFLVRTIYAIIVLTIFLHYGQVLITADDGSLIQVLGPDNRFMGVILGCVLAGAALALVFSHKGSTGGTDIVAAIINKYKNCSIGTGLIIIDICVIASSMFFPQFGDMVERTRILVFGICCVFIETQVLDFIMNQQRSSVQFLIFTDKYQEIANAIGMGLNHGVTILNAEGWYTGEKRKVLCILARKNESVEIFRIIKEIDPKAFVSQSRVIGVYGEGFDVIRH